jgi:transposase
VRHQSLQASSGKVARHRLNQDGNSEASNAVWRIVMVRLTCDQRTRNYLTRRRAEGKNDREIIRCLKRYIAREVYTLITSPPSVPDSASLRAAQITLATAAAQLGTWDTRLSRLERGLTHDSDLASRYYQQWLSHQTAVCQR